VVEWKRIGISGEYQYLSRSKTRSLRGECFSKIKLNIVRRRHCRSLRHVHLFSRVGSRLRTEFSRRIFLKERLRAFGSSPRVFVHGPRRTGRGNKVQTRESLLYFCFMLHTFRDSNTSLNGARSGNLTVLAGFIFTVSSSPGFTTFGLFFSKSSVACGWTKRPFAGRT